jgi:hypothetical protein
MTRPRKIARPIVRNPAYRQALQRLDEALVQNAPSDNSEKLDLMGQHLFGDLWFKAKQSRDAALPK